MALANGTVSAVVTLEPYATQTKNELVGKVAEWDAQADQISYYDAICTRSWTLAHPDLIVRFLKALAQAENFVTSERGQAMSIVEKAFNYNSSYLESVWSEYVFTVTLDQAQLLALQDQSRWLINNNLTNATVVPNFLNYVYLEGLEAVDPNLVTIIH